jgi:hypothetical protein
MNFGDYLKATMNDVVDGYRRWALPAFTVTFIFSLLSVAASAAFLLMMPGSLRAGAGLLDFFFSFYPSGKSDQYAFVDLSRSAWFVCIAFFAIGWHRLSVSDQEDHLAPLEAVRWGPFIRNIDDKDFFIILGTGIGIGFIDYLLFEAKGMFEQSMTSPYSGSSEFWLWFITELRFFLPPLIMTAVLKSRLFPQARPWRVAGWSYALAGLWLMELVCSQTVWVVEHLLQLLSVFSIPITATVAVVLSYVIPAPVIAYFFVGFAAVMIRAAKPVGAPAAVVLDADEPSPVAVAPDEPVTTARPIDS